MLKLMIVDDEKLLRKGFIHMTNWSQHDCEIVGEAANGEEALKLIPECLPDVLFTDIKMPVMDGIQLLRKVKLLYPHMDVIILSSYSDFPYVKQSLQLGAIDYILKASMSYEEVLGSLDIVKRKKRQQLPPAPAVANQVAVNEADPELATEAFGLTIQAVLRYLQENYQREDISLAAVAATVHMNKSYLSQLFKKLTGVNFHTYLTELRIAKAKELLLNHVPVGEVCYAVGFENVSYFSQLFKRWVGSSPSEYKREYEAGKLWDK